MLQKIFKMSGKSKTVTHSSYRVLFLLEKQLLRRGRRRGGEEEEGEEDQEQEEEDEEEEEVALECSSSVRRARDFTPAGYGFDLRLCTGWVGVSIM